METQKNVLKRILGMFSHPTETLEEICKVPSSWKIIFLLLVANLTIIFVYIVQIPTGLNSILIGASLFPVYIIVLLFLVVMIIFAVILLGIINFIYFIGVRLRRSRSEHRSRKIIFNIYVYSLVPAFFLLSQLPFILIFGGHYSLFQLRIFFYILFGIIIGWHVLLSYKGIQTQSDISPNRAKLIAGLYIGIIGSSTGFLIYAILYIPFSISWLGLIY